MVIIPILGESFLDVLKGFKGGIDHVTTIEPSALVVGFFAAFVSGVIACNWMLKIVKNSKLIYFAIYCGIVGAFALIYSLIA